MNRMKLIKITSFFLVVFFAVSLFPVLPVTAETVSAQTLEELLAATESLVGLPDYAAYLAEHAGAGFAGQTVTVNGAEGKPAENADAELLPFFEDKENVLNFVSGTVNWTIQAPEEGFYALKVDYYPLSGTGSDIEMELQVNGQIPFKQAAVIPLRRQWVNAGPVRTDKKGNEIAPEQIELPGWNEEIFTDRQGVEGTLKVFLQQGENTLSLSLKQESLVLEKLTFFTPDPVLSYNELDFTMPDSSGNSDNIYAQGQDADIKNSMMLHSVYDRGSAALMPADPTKVVQNAIGGENWKQSGQRITWNVNVTNAGYYKLAFHVQQNYLRGLFVTRRLLIDGKPPFAEAEYLQFKYKSNWYMKTAGDEEPYLFYFTEGTHTVSLEVTMGELSDTMATITESVRNLNEMYRRILMITSTNPDPLRDYMLESQIPDLLETLTKNAAVLKTETEKIRQLTGTAGSEISLLSRVQEQLESFVKKPETIPDRLQAFSGNISSLGTMIITLQQQSLKVDYFMLVPKEATVPTGKVSFWKTLMFNIKAFLNSFTSSEDDMAATSENENSISVWLSMDALTSTFSENTSGGRDQMQILKVLIDEGFTPEYGIDVSVGMVQGALLNAVLAGKGPDVSLMVANDLPVNLSMRGGLVPVSDFGDYSQVAERFFPEAMKPFLYKEKIYALPEVQNFNMLFYRTDILDSMGLKPPRTWDDIFLMLPVLQRNNMNFGIPASQQIFESVLLQYGVPMYNEDLSATSFDTPEALKAFKFWTDFYTKYSIPQQYDFYNRFRTGEMPIGIAVYNTYNLLSVAAPELQGQWRMTTMPGFQRADGTVSIAESSSGLAGIILKDTKNKEAAWQFLKWWTDAPTQTKYGVEMEALLGPGGRYNTANVEAFKKLPWSKSEQEILLKQWENVENNVLVPGSYFIYRNLNNAFRRVVNNLDNPRETLDKYNKYMNDELQRKQKEFS